MSIKLHTPFATPLCVAATTFQTRALTPYGPPFCPTG